MLLLCLKSKKMTFYFMNYVSVNPYIYHRNFLHSGFISYCSKCNFI